MTAPLTEAEILDALRARWPKGSAAILPQVADKTGTARRYADAVVMQLWRSRGLLLEGVEVKRYRSDWLRERNDPRKAEAIFRFCDRWWLVTPPGVAGAEEIPETWGLIVVDGKRVKVVKKAPPLKPDPITREFLAAVLRRLEEHEVSAAELEAVRERARDEGRQQERDARAWEVKLKEQEVERLEKQLQELRATVRAFEAASGVQLSRWGDPNDEQAKRIGRHVRFLAFEHPHALERLEELRKGLAGVGRLCSTFADELGAKLEKENESA